MLFALPFPNSIFWSSFLFVSLALGVKERLPFRHRLVVSDGRRLWLLFGDPVGCRRWLALMRLGAEMRAGVLPEAYSEGALADALAPSPRWLRTRVEAAIREARGDLGGALAKLDELERDYDAIPDRAARGMLSRLLERWRSDLRRASIAQGSSLEGPVQPARPGQIERASSP